MYRFNRFDMARFRYFPGADFTPVRSERRGFSDGDGVWPLDYLVSSDYCSAGLSGRLFTD